MRSRLKDERGKRNHDNDHENCSGGEVRRTDDKQESAYQCGCMTLRDQCYSMQLGMHCRSRGTVALVPYLIALSGWTGRESWDRGSTMRLIDAVIGDGWMIDKAFHSARMKPVELCKTLHGKRFWKV